MTWRRDPSAETDQAVFAATIAYLDRRLEDRATIEWAIKLGRAERAQRLAVLALIDHPGREIAEPWQTAWRLVEEFWDAPSRSNSSIDAYRVRQRLAAGERTGSLISSMVALVAPRLEISAFTDRPFVDRKLPTRPRTIGHLFSVNVTSNDFVKYTDLALTAVDDAGFLFALAQALEGALNNGLNLARRLGWDGETRLWRLGEVRRVYFVEVRDEDDDDDAADPDRFTRGIAPSIKLLHAAVEQLARVAPHEALEFMRSWRSAASPIYVRLWAALARDPQLATPEEVGGFILGLDARRFWYLLEFPEIAELRTRRFAELDEHQRRAIVGRLRKGPPRSQWRREKNRARVDEARLYWTVRELRRIETGGGDLPDSARRWLARNIDQFPEFRAPVPIQEGFLDGPRVRHGGADPDARYDDLIGVARLQALAESLSSTRRGWDDDPAERAGAWITQPGNGLLLLDDFEGAPNAGGDFPVVWERWGWHFSPTPGRSEPALYPDRDLKAEGARILALLLHLPDETITSAINGITHLISSWEDVTSGNANALAAWQKVWPLAVTETNATTSAEGDFDLGVVASGPADGEPMDLDTLNTPAGRLVGVFLAACPTASRGTKPFAAGSPAQIMRDIVIEAPGRSGLIAKHRMIESLGYFHYADATWTKANLLPPLKVETPESLPLWRAVARRRLSAKAIRLLKDAILRRAIDPRLGRDTRRSLIFSIVVDALHAIRRNKASAIPLPRLQQLLRSLDDEVRAHAADTIQRFVRDVSSKSDGKPPPTAEALFRDVAAYFLRNVWPQERSLSTPGISQALAELPAASKNAFADAVDAIERFLVPFDCWSLMDYGLYGEDGTGQAKLSMIDTPEKARAMLTLLDRTVGSNEAAVVPHGLGSALERIGRISPELEETQAFRRLATAAR